MDLTILQRVFALSQCSATKNQAVAAQVLRQIAAEKTPAAVAHTITGILSKLKPEDQEAVLDAVEALSADMIDAAAGD